MWTDYFLYLNSLSKVERENQILLLTAIFTLLFIIGLIDQYIRDKKKHII